MNPKTSRPAINVDIRLMTAPAQRMQRWLTDRLDGIFYMLEMVYSHHDDVSQQSIETIEKITQKLSGLEQSIKKFLNKQPTFESDAPTISYSAPKNITVRCTTPQACCCTELLKGYDQLVQHYDRLWLAGKTSREEAFQITKDWSLAISKNISECSDLYHKLKRQAPTHRDKTDVMPSIPKQEIR